MPEDRPSGRHSRAFWRAVRSTALTLFMLAAPTGIALSNSDHSHREVSYVAWYGLAAFALIVIVATTRIIDRRRAGAARGAGATHRPDSIAPSAAQRGADARAQAEPTRSAGVPKVP